MANNTNSKIGKQYHSLAVADQPRVKRGQGNSKPLAWTLRATDNTRKDINDWRNAIKLTEATEHPSNAKLQTIYKNIMEDALLTSQVENRKTKLFGMDFHLKNENGEINEEQTKILTDDVPFRQLTTAILETIYYEYSLVQLNWEENIEGTSVLKCESLPRTNIVPQDGTFIPDLADSYKRIPYREAPEYGIWWLEFGSAKERGLLNKATPHVLMKSFAQSCWAELCEIYGIPPRYMKTNTQDPNMLKRAEMMMRDMGAAAWFIIDETEEFNFAQGVSTNGDVYNGLIRLCNNENSMLISGAIIGQDTVNGNYSKEESSQKMLDALALTDVVLVEENWNNIVLPALRKLGVITGDVTFAFEIPEDLEALWGKVKEAMNNYEFDVDWLNEKFNLKITGVKQAPTFGGLNAGESFFV